MCKGGGALGALGEGSALIHSQSWIFLIHMDVSDDLRIFSMYTPLNPLEMQASSMASRPIREECK